ncbi:hypothetical protein TRFO_35546 [Tritrichomonas foetus]|uniref:Uncharacterized protein n=1 Tax=Tritrichomonas foetus TaxID=1144522 RepID=A0A1J4JKJ7_9EUKA|nr:hypothetical protein TRFO_35546 [Tritrichomonas foetus]|eukprot:OHS98083.1 hypothetical protein TRFO_35546 [Tritrichomonas foetus]
MRYFKSIECFGRISYNISLLMRAILQDETSLETPLDRMSNASAFIWLVIIFSSLLISSLVSFIPSNTSIIKSLSNNYPQGESLISHRSQFDRLTPFSGFLYLYITPNFEIYENKNLTFSIKGYLKFLDNSLNEYQSQTITKNMSLICTKISCPPIPIFETNLVDFSAISLYADVECNFPGMTSVTFWSLSLRTTISIIGCFLIMLITIPISLLLIFIVPSRFRPSTKDHKATLFLGIGLIFIDGPWLLMRYYIPSYSSHVFDISPDFFHLIFIIFSMYFISSRTLELPNRIFNSKLILLSVCSLCVMNVAIQLMVTDFMPPSTLSLHINESSLLKYSFYTIAFIYHGIVIGLLIFGVLFLQIESFQVLLLVSFSLIILEVIDIIRTLLRMFISIDQIGFCFATDLFYILMANVISFFFLSSNLPNGFHIPASQEEDGQVLDVIPDDE